MRIPDCMRAEDAIKKCFPEISENILGMVTCSDIVDHTDILEKIGADTDSISRFSEMMSEGPGIAMEFIGPFGPVPGYAWSTDDCLDTRPRMNMVMFTDMNGNPTGMLPLGCGRTFHREVYRRLRGCNRTIITDRIPYSDENEMALESAGTEYLLVEPPFPLSFQSTRNARMLSLRHNGKDIWACKIRYNRKWLFRFTDLGERNRADARMLMNGVRYPIPGAGSTDVISNTGFDIREVRRLLDIRDSADSMMKQLMMSPGLERIADSEDAVTGFVFVSLLERMLGRRNMMEQQR